jgi:hypothetical protein
VLSTPSTLCRPDAPLNHAPFALDQFQFRQPQQVTGVIDRRD